MTLRPGSAPNHLRGDPKPSPRRGGPPRVLRIDNSLELVSAALQRFCENQTGITYILPRCQCDNGCIESFHNRLRTECLDRTTSGSDAGARFARRG
ncbi:MAG: hypothetical protein NVS4B6_15070 [Mycobacterium sp.]